MPTGFAEVHDLPAVLGVGGGVLAVDQVLRNHDDAADKEGENGENRCSCGTGDAANRGENARADGRSDSQGDCRRQAQVAFKLT